MPLATPHGVVLAALMHPVPCPRCERTTPCRCLVDPSEKLDWQARLIVTALEEFDLLSKHNVEPDEPDIERLATWLAEQSGHPRYVGVEEGWRQLLDSDRNVHHAHAAALKAHPAPSREFERDLANARDQLLRHVTARRAAEMGG